MIRIIRVAALQLRAHDRDDFPSSVETIIASTREAAYNADLIVLPEATLPAYVLGAAPIDETAITRALDRLREIAAATKSVIVVGAAHVRDGVTRNAAFAIDADGSLAGDTDKLFLWHFDRRWFGRGERLEPIATAVGTLGVLICADGRIPTIARTLVDRGASALIMPTAWVTSGRNPNALENVQADLLARVRAYENRVPFVAANKCGSELGMVAYCGKSQIVNSNGDLVAIASEREAEILYGTVEVGADDAPRAGSLANPPRASSAIVKTLRLAISYDPLPKDIDVRLELLDDAYALSPHDRERLTALEKALPVASVTDEVVCDPAGLVGFRLAGYVLICWTSELGAPWVERLARARALELRLYVAVFDHSARRAFAVDPDGTIVAGTFDDFRLASFTLDPRKTAETFVAPETDLREGLERVATIAERSPRAAT